MSQVEQFVSKFSQWSDKQGLPKNKRAQLSAALRKAINDKLPDLDDYRDVLIRPLTNSRNLIYSFESSEKWLEISNKGLIAGVTMPYWATGWRHISKDYVIECEIASFFHFASQYVARSRVNSFIGAIVLTYSRVCDFRSKWVSRLTVGSNATFKTINDAKNFTAQIGNYTGEENYTLTEGNFSDKSSRQREVTMWVNKINALDPFIHRAIYQYWRATALYNSDFYEESITALDGLTSVAAQFAKERLGFSGNPRKSLGAIFNLSPSNEKNLIKLYDLRCNFGAHPSNSKWWDFSEIYDKEIDDFRDTSKKLVFALCQAESNNRIVEPYPDSWSHWFSDNALMLLNVVWFLHIH
jgi:hypothetical protein